MKKVIKVVDEEKRIAQVTVADERFYVREATDPVTGLPAWQYVPSVTWIAGFYPKGVPFYKWLADKGWDEAEAIKSAAGTKGSKVHLAIEALLAGREIAMDAKILNKETGQEEELTLEEYECIVSFRDWWNGLPNKKLISSEIVVWNDEYGYAGTVDLVMEIDGEPWIIDLKTGASVWPEYELQVSAYKHARPAEYDAGEDYDQEYKLAILQLGYKRNKHAYKFTEVEDQFPLFLAARQIWAKETEGVEPKKRDYPLSVKIAYEEQQGVDEGREDLPEAPARDEAPRRRSKVNRTASR